MIDHLLAIKEAVATASAAGLTALLSADQERFLKALDSLQRVFLGKPFVPDVNTS